MVYLQVHAESATPPPPPPKKLLKFVQISRPTLAEVGWARAHPWLRQWRFRGSKYARNAFAAGAPPRTPLAELIALPQTP